MKLVKQPDRCEGAPDLISDLYGPHLRSSKENEFNRRVYNLRFCGARTLLSSDSNSSELDLRTTNFYLSTNTTLR